MPQKPVDYKLTTAAHAPRRQNEDAPLKENFVYAPGHPVPPPTTPGYRPHATRDRITVRVSVCRPAAPTPVRP